METELERQHARHKQFHSSIAQAARKLSPPPIPARLKMTPIDRVRLVENPNRPPPRKIDENEERAWMAAVCEPDAELPGDKIIPTVLAIQRAVCKHFNISRAQMTGPVRTANFVRPRFVAIWLCRTLTKRSLPQIGKMFGGRDHTSALNAFRKLELLMQSEPVLAAEVAEIRSQFMEPAR